MAAERARVPGFSASARRPTGAGRAGGAGRGGAERSGRRGHLAPAPARAQTSARARDSGRLLACQLPLAQVQGGGMWGGAKRKAGPREGWGRGFERPRGSSLFILRKGRGLGKSPWDAPASGSALRCACAGACWGPGSRPPGEWMLALRAHALGRRHGCEILPFWLFLQNQAASLVSTRSVPL